MSSAGHIKQEAAWKFKGWLSSSSSLFNSKTELFQIHLHNFSAPSEILKQLTKESSPKINGIFLENYSV